MDTLRSLKEELESFRSYLIEDEKSAVTVEKYLRDVGRFLDWLECRELSKEEVVSWKERLKEMEYKPASINSMLSSLNKWLLWKDHAGFRVRMLRVQNQAFLTGDQELERSEYGRLLKAAGRNQRLKLVMETICSTGIRVSELKYFTVENVSRGAATVQCKNKLRTILIPGKLQRRLLRYADKAGIKEGLIFRTRSGRTLDRSNIWAAMKALSSAAKVSAEKVFPHNLRKLFARAFYKAQHDIAKLADVLGHSSINTTRIYIKTTSTEHRRIMESLQLIM